MKPTKSWKTTVFGCIVAAWVVVEPLINSEVLHWPTVIKAAAIAIAGFLVKDWNVTGNGDGK